MIDVFKSKNKIKLLFYRHFLTSQTLNYWELLFCVFVIKNLFYYFLNACLAETILTPNFRPMSTNSLVNPELLSTKSIKFVFLI